jgi:hypothetical protein
MVNLHGSLYEAWIYKYTGILNQTQGVDQKWKQIFSQSDQAELVADLLEWIRNLGRRLKDDQ